MPPSSKHKVASTTFGSSMKNSSNSTSSLSAMDFYYDSILRPQSVLTDYDKRYRNHLSTRSNGEMATRNSYFSSKLSRMYRSNSSAAQASCGVLASVNKPPSCNVSSKRFSLQHTLSYIGGCTRLIKRKISTINTKDLDLQHDNSVLARETSESTSTTCHLLSNQRRVIRIVTQRKRKSDQVKDDLLTVDQQPVSNSIQRPDLTRTASPSSSEGSSSSYTWETCSSDEEGPDVRYFPPTPTSLTPLPSLTSSTTTLNPTATVASADRWTRMMFMTNTKSKRMSLQEHIVLDRKNNTVVDGKKGRKQSEPCMSKTNEGNMFDVPIEVVPTETVSGGISKHVDSLSNEFLKDNSNLHDTELDALSTSEKSCSYNECNEFDVSSTKDDDDFNLRDACDNAYSNSDSPEKFETIKNVTPPPNSDNNDSQTQIMMNQYETHPRNHSPDGPDNDSVNETGNAFRSFGEFSIQDPEPLENSTISECQVSKDVENDNEVKTESPANEERRHDEISDLEIDTIENLLKAIKEIKVRKDLTCSTTHVDSSLSEDYLSKKQKVLNLCQTLIENSSSTALMNNVLVDGGSTDELVAVDRTDEFRKQKVDDISGANEHVINDHIFDNITVKHTASDGKLIPEKEIADIAEITKSITDTTDRPIDIQEDSPVDNGIEEKNVKNTGRSSSTSLNCESTSSLPFSKSFEISNLTTNVPPDAARSSSEENSELIDAGISSSTADSECSCQSIDSPREPEHNHNLNDKSELKEYLMKQPETLKDESEKVDGVAPMSDVGCTVVNSKLESRIEPTEPTDYSEKRSDNLDGKCQKTVEQNKELIKKYGGIEFKDDDFLEITPSHWMLLDHEEGDAFPFSNITGDAKPDTVKAKSNNNCEYKYTTRDFLFHKLLGKGSFGRVILAEFVHYQPSFKVKRRSRKLNSGFRDLLNISGGNNNKMTSPSSLVPINEHNNNCIMKHNTRYGLGEKFMVPDMPSGSLNDIFPRYVAVKCLRKDVILEEDDLECALIERQVLILASKHPFLCHLFCSFQTDTHLFLVMEYVNGGDLMYHIQKSGRFKLERARFYAAQLLLALEFIHQLGIVYRDLKLDNVLLDAEGHIRLADFGMCKIVDSNSHDNLTESFCGTPDYMAPEIIRGDDYDQRIDWWSYGVLLYEMIVGKSPFTGKDEKQLFWSICNEHVFLPTWLNQHTRSILFNLLQKDPRRRLSQGCNQYNGQENQTHHVIHLGGSIQSHPFFDSINFFKLGRKEVPPPFIPVVNGPTDISNFDKSFTEDNAKLSPIPRNFVNSVDQSQFKGFSVVNKQIKKKHNSCLVTHL